MMRRSFDGHIYALTTDKLNSSERTFKSYTLLLRLVPRLEEMLDDSSVDTDTFNRFIAEVRMLFISRVSLSFNKRPSFKRVQMMHAVTMSGA